MLNLAYPIDDTVEIDGKSYKLDASYDNILRLLDMLEDKTIDDVLKVNTGLLMLLNNTLDDYSIEEKAKIFVSLFKNVVGEGTEETQAVDLDGNPMPVVSGDSKKVYDLAQDADYIYASFMHCYQIDLFEQQGKLHWNKFKALLNGLSEDTIFGRVIEIRTAELPSGKGTSKQREKIKRLKKQYALKNNPNDIVE